MKLKITEKGFENLTGPIAEVMFADGVSVDEVSGEQAQRISAAMRCETLEGVNPSASAEMLRSHAKRADVVAEMKRGEEDQTPHAIVEAASPIAKSEGSADAWTRETLEAVADKGGIKGLRAIAEPLGVKATSIKELITEVLDAQAAKFATEKRD